MANAKELYNIITSDDGYIVCNDCIFKEAISCFLQLVEMDKLDGTYKEGFYKIVSKEETKVSEMLGAYAKFAKMAHGYVCKPKADGKTCFYIGMICNMTHEESMSFMEYILDKWNAYTMDIINGRYCYVLLTEMVYDSWIEYRR